MSYIQKSLSKNEKLIYKFGLNKYTLLMPYVFMFLATIIMVSSIIMPSSLPSSFDIASAIVSLVFFIYGFYLHYYLKSTEYGITSKRIIKKTGIIVRNTDELLNSAVETIEIHQDILGRILGYGTVVLTGRGNSIVSFPNVDEPMKIKIKIKIEEVIFNEK